MDTLPKHEAKIDTNSKSKPSFLTKKGIGSLGPFSRSNGIKLIETEGEETLTLTSDQHKVGVLFKLRMLKSVQSGQIKQDKCRSSRTNADQVDHVGENQIKPIK